MYVSVGEKNELIKIFISQNIERPKLQIKGVLKIIHR